MIHPHSLQRGDRGDLESHRFSRTLWNWLSFRLRTQDSNREKPKFQHKNRMAPAGRFAAIAVSADPDLGNFPRFFEEAFDGTFPLIAPTLDSGSYSPYGIDNC